MTIPGYVPPIGEKDPEKISRSVRNLYEGATALEDTRFGAVRIQVFTADGTYTPHANMKYAIIEAVGGGGGGGGSTGNASYLTSGGGGGSGAYSRKVVTASDVGASKTVTIGAGGTGVSNANGNSGGDTSVGTLCVAKGGSFGTLGTSGAFGAGGTGGLASGGTGDFKSNGNYGAYGPYNSGSSGFVPAAAYGGASVFGGGTRTTAASTGTKADGVAGTEYGSGGSGSMSNFVATNGTGGDGFKGCVIITEYCTS